MERKKPPNTEKINLLTITPEKPTMVEETDNLKLATFNELITQRYSCLRTESALHAGKLLHRRLGVSSSCPYPRYLAGNYRCASLPKRCQFDLALTCA